MRWRPERLLVWTASGQGMKWKEIRQTLQACSLAVRLWAQKAATLSRTA